MKDILKNWHLGVTFGFRAKNGWFSSEEAKRLLSKKERVTSVSEKLSFENPQYFAKVFKQRVGTTPKEYREHNFKI